MASKDVCLANLKQEFGEIFDNEALESVINDVAEKLGAKMDEGKALSLATAELIESMRENIGTRKLVLMQETEKFVALARRADQEGFRIDPDEYVLSVLGGGDVRKTVGGMRGLYGDAQALENSATVGFFNDLEARGGKLAGKPGQRTRDLVKIYHSGKLDKEIFMEYYTPGSSKSKQAVEIAEALRSLNNETFDNLKSAGSTLKYRRTRLIQQSTSPEKIGHGDQAFKDWSEFMKNEVKVDWEKTFGTADPDEIETGLRKLFDNYSEERFDLELEDVFPEDITSPSFKLGDINKKVSKSRILEFADGESAFKYNQKYGKQNLAEAVHWSVVKQSHDAATIRHLGVNPEKMLEKVEGIAASIAKTKKAREKVLSKSSGTQGDKSYRQALDVVMGRDFVIGNNAAVQFIRASRGIFGATMLGSSPLSTVTDAVTSAYLLKSATGQNIFEAQSNQIGNWVNSVSTEHRGFIAADAGLRYSHDIGAVMSRMGMDNPDDIPKSLQKLTSLGFRLTLLEQITAVTRQGHAQSHMRAFGAQAKQSFGELDEAMRNNLQRFGMNAEDWDVMRLSPKEDLGKDAITRTQLKFSDPAAIDAGVRSKFKQTGRKFTRAEYIKDLELAYMNYLGTMSDMATGTAGGREKIFMRNMGFKPGTVMGELSKSFWQFSSYAVTMQRNLKFAMFSQKGTKGLTWGETLKNPNSMAAITGFAAQLTLMGYVAQSLRDVSNGMSPRDPRKDPMGTMRDSIVAGGAGGLLGGLMFSKYAQHQGVLGGLAGPLFSKVDDVKDVWHNLISGDVDGAGKKAFSSAIQTVPNLFYAKILMNQMFLYQLQEMINPGFAARLEGRAREQGSEFFKVPGLIKTPTEKVR